MSTKLKGTRSGHRSALTRLLRRFDDVTSKEEFDRDEVSTILDLIIDKQRFLSDLNNQIISELSEEELEAEISDSDEYSITLETKIRKMRKCLETTARSYSLPVTDSSLNPLAQSFDVNRNQTASFNSQLINSISNHNNKDNKPASSDKQEIAETASAMHCTTYSQVLLKTAIATVHSNAQVMMTTTCKDYENQETQDDIIRTKNNVLNIINVDRYNSFNKTVRILGYVQKFIDNCRNTAPNTRRLTTTYLTPNDIHNATMKLIEAVQHERYSDVFESLCSKSTHSLIRQLRLYLDKDGLIRCGGF
ncbi:unnamed protein product [Mytilus edulis]|uniref:Uncharacterized protein n=1 Tax=Mytilus edulis TaxID=6550 RepID=A0A8S3RRS8_MYTED|nr:unnamed protein product [Mytilus edulis]